MLKKEEMRQWLRDRLQTQNRLTIGSFAALSVIGAVATIMEFTVFYLIIRIGFIESRILAVLVTLGIQAMIQMFTIWQLPKQLPDVKYEAELESGRLSLRTAPGMPAIWTYAFGSLETDRSWVEMLAGILTLPQRMCAAAWYTWQRQKELQTIAVEPCAAIIRLLHKEGERVELQKIATDLSTENLPAIMRQLSLIDGVVFLTRKTFGLSLATRLVDDLVEWKEKKSRQQSVEA